MLTWRLIRAIDHDDGSPVTPGVRRRRHGDDQQARPSIGHAGSPPKVVMVPG